MFTDLLNIRLIMDGIFTSVFLQDGPAQTFKYFLAGYGVIFGVMAIYLISMIVRKHNLQQDLAALDEIEENPR